MIKIQSLDSTTVIAAIVVILVIGVLLGHFGSGRLDIGNLSPKEAGEIAISFINQSIEDEVTASLIEVIDEGQVYLIHLEIEGNEYNSFITKDGRLLFPNGFSLEEKQ